MSIEFDKRAQAAFDELDAMDISSRMDALRDESYEGYSVPCSARLAGRVLKRVGIEVDELDIHWTKLAGRSVAHVYRMTMKCLESPEEETTTIIREFGKKRKMLPGAEDDFLEHVFEEAG